MKIVLIGGGPANLFLATKLLEKKYTVELYEKTTGPGKKFLVAGKSGLNITHSESVKLMSAKYFEQKDLFYKLLTDFSNTDLISWLDSICVCTFIYVCTKLSKIYIINCREFLPKFKLWFKQSSIELSPIHQDFAMDSWISIWQGRCWEEKVARTRSVMSEDLIS